MKYPNKITFLLIVAIILSGIALLSGCNSNKADHGTQNTESKITEKQQAIHLKSTPSPQLKDSLERANLIRRLKLFNDPNKVSYIYLIEYGKVMAFYTIKGKVSSVNSLLTTPDQIVDHRKAHKLDAHYSAHVVASPDLDGSYGTNGDAVFFFLTDGTYVEWRGDYMLCDKPLKMSTPPLITMEVGENE